MPGQAETVDVWHSVEGTIRGRMPSAPARSAETRQHAAMLSRARQCSVAEMGAVRAKLAVAWAAEG